MTPPQGFRPWLRMIARADNEVVRRAVMTALAATCVVAASAGCTARPTAGPTTTTTTSATSTTGVSTTPTTTTRPLPGVDANCLETKGTSTKPASIVIACGADGTVLFQDLSWTSWTEHAATGTGQLWENDCLPDCAGGTYLKYEASVTLTTVVASIYGPVFSVVNASYPKGGPNGDASGQFPLPTPPPPSPTCTASQLKGSVVGSLGPPSTTGDFSFEHVVLTNIGSQGCHMEGFPGFDVLDGSGTSIINASRGCPWAPTGWCPATLDYLYLSTGPGAQNAEFNFAWQSSPEGGQRCPQSASALVTPPNAYDHLTLPLPISVCGEPLRLGVSTVYY